MSAKTLQFCPSLNVITDTVYTDNEEVPWQPDALSTHPIYQVNQIIFISGAIYF